MTERFRRVHALWDDYVDVVQNPGVAALLTLADVLLSIKEELERNPRPSNQELEV